MKIIVIPDSHIEPGQSYDRARWLGQYINEAAPDVVLHIGDLAEMGSLSTHTIIKESEYKHDVACTLGFQEVLAEAGKRGWNRARKVFLVGNHEARIHRMLEENPALHGAIDPKHLGLWEFWDEVYDWEGGPTVAEIEGVRFAHYFQSRMGRALSGVNHARTLLTNNMQSSVCGHSHALSYHAIPLPNGKHIHGLVCGCFFEQRQHWAGQSNERYWRGFAVLHDVKDGEFDLELVSMHRLKGQYA